MKYSQQSHSSAGYHNMRVVLFTLLCLLICGSLSLSLKAQTKTSGEHVTPKSVLGRNGKIAFAGSDGFAAIYTTEADGSNVQRITRNPRHDISPRWSPDGTKIAFESIDNIGEIYVMNADGSNQTRLTNNPAHDFSPIFSPDGTRIAFGSRRDNNSEIYVMNADGTNQTRLTNDPADDYSYAWSPDSSRIAFTRVGDIYVINADGTNQTRLTTSGSDGSPIWSPDGTRIAFLSGSVAGNAGLSVMNTDGSNQTRLTNAYHYYDSPPDWSPDGSRIAFLSNPDNNYDIYVINADGSNQTRLTNDPAFDSSPVFSPDGTRIAFLSDRDKIDNGWNYNDKIYVMNADGSSQTRLTNTADELYEFKPDWHALPSPSCPNPIDCAEFFVRQQYLDFLNREPDAGGLAYWTNEITRCGSDVRCIHDRRIGVSGAFFVEPEFQGTGYFVDRRYQASFGHHPTFAQFNVDRAQLTVGPNLEASKQALAANWVERTAFKDAYSMTLSPDEFVNKLFDTANLRPYTTERQQLATDMRNGKSRAQVLREVIEIPEFKTRQYNPAFVLTQYFGYLRRNADQSGYDFWLDVLNNRDRNNYSGMICSFITSREYQERFGSTVTRSNADCGP